MLEKLKERGLDYSRGLLCVIDGAKGIRKALKDTFGHKAVIQRCQYHKRDNILSYLNQADQDDYKRKISTAYSMSDYEDAKIQLLEIAEELEEKNMAAVNSIKEGLEETLTLHKLGVNVKFDRTFSTTNPIENVNSQVQNYTQKVKHWQNSKMRYRWLASALLECESKMRRVNNYRELNLIQESVEKLVNKRESKNN
jgi:transposase-like protein